MYDTTECLEESGQAISQQRSESEKRRTVHNKCREQSQEQVDHGIELQVLSGIIDYIFYFLNLSINFTIYMLKLIFKFDTINF